MAVPSEPTRPSSHEHGPPPGPGRSPSIWPVLALYTLGRIVLAAALVAVLWVAGLGSFPGLLFGLLLSMPLSFVLLKPLRERLTGAMAARATTRAEAKQDLRARLQGTDDPIS